MAQHNPGSIYLAVAFIFVIAGFLVKAAAFPFHFWLADAHAVAPTPVCILFSGIMVELGLFAIVRIYFGIFAHSFAPHEETIRHLLITIGAATALIGAIECFGQRHIKRMLAFSTISHAGVMLIGLGLLDSMSLAGMGLYVFGHGMVKAALFIGAGILLHHFASVDEFDLHGKGKNYPGLGIIMVIATLGLLSLPPFGTFFGEEMIEHAAEELHLGWLSIILFIASAMTGGTIFRMIGRVFLGLGSSDPPKPGTPEGREKRETSGTPGKTELSMWMPAACLLLIGATITVSPTVRQSIDQHTKNLIETHLFSATVLSGDAFTPAQPDALPEFSIWRKLLGLAAAIAIALISIFPNFLPIGFVKKALMGLSKASQVFQSGRIGDYVTWLVLGLAVWGGWLVFALR